MSIEQSIQALLAGLGNAYQDVAPQNTAAPYIVWMQVVSTTNNTLQGPSNTQNTRIQVDVYAKSQASRKTLADQVEAAMAAATFTSIQLTSQNLYEPETKLFRALLEFSVWST